MNPEVEKWHIGNMSYLVDRARTYLNLYNRYGKVSDGTKEYFFIANELWATAVFIKNVFLSKNGSIPSELKKAFENFESQFASAIPPGYDYFEED